MAVAPWWPDGQRGLVSAPRRRIGMSRLLTLRSSIRSVLAVALVASGTAGQERELGCADCHSPQEEELRASVHEHIRCQACHGGSESYSLTADEVARFRPAGGELGGMPAFAHGATFAGKASRSQVPERCGGCHSDVERMNPYGLRTDQLARYWTSGHGKTLKSKGDERVAVCTDCHGVHDVVPAGDPRSKTHPTNVPDMCGSCHSNASLMGEYDLSVAVVDEYMQSVHGHLLLELGDTGAPTCATCHGNHAAMPPGFASVGAVCGKCHVAAARHFEESIHSEIEWFNGCVQCHGGGPDRHFHLIEKITKPAGVMLQRYAHLIEREPQPTPEEITAAIHSDPKEIMQRVLPSCEDCHDPLEESESLQKLFGLLDEISRAERIYVETGRRIDLVGQGVLLVERERFLFQDAKTHLVELAPLQHTLDNEKIDQTVAELEEICGEVNAQLDAKIADLRWRQKALVPVWAFAVVFSALLYVKYKQLRKRHVKPLPRDAGGPS